MSKENCKVTEVYKFREIFHSSILAEKDNIWAVWIFVFKTNERVGPLSYEDLLCKVSLDFSSFSAFSLYFDDFFTAIK